MAQSNAGLTSDQKFAVRSPPAIFFVEIGHEIFPVIIFSLPLIQEEHLSVSGERVCTSAVIHHIED